LASLLGRRRFAALQFGDFSARAALFVRPRKRKPLRQRAPRAGS